MVRDPRAWLWDAREAADAIAGFVAGVEYPAYASNAMLHSAVERKFEIMGEALNQLSRIEPAIAARIPEVPRIVAFRNILIHGYAAVDHARVWRTIHESLPEVRAAIAAVLSDMGE